MAVAESRNPFVGPYSFEEKDAPLFFGRDREAQHLTAMIVSERVVLFYAPSGAGKTSLVNARLVPELKRKGFHVFPPVRVGGELPPGAAPRNVYVYNALESLDGSHPPDESLDGFLRTDPAGKSEGSPPRVLILDQFEEILTTHPERWIEREGFFVQLRQALQDDPSLSVMLVLREDHLAGLDRYAPLLGGHLRARFRLERLRREQAIAAIRKPAEAAGRPFEPEVAEQLAEELSRERRAGQEATYLGDLVEPVQLQVVCFQLWENLRRRPGGTITSQDRKDFGDVDRALESFYEAAVARAAREAEMPADRIRHWCGTTLITPTRIRAQVSREPEFTGGLPNDAVEALVKTHLIRPEEARGGIWYELAHDRLIDPILSSNAKATPEERRQLTADAERWKRAGREPSFLYRGSQLEQALKLEREQGPVSELEREFLHASQVMETKSARRMRLLVATLVPLLLAVAFFAFRARGGSQISASRELASAAINKIQEDPELSLLLALEAVERSSTAEAERALHEVLYLPVVGTSVQVPIPFDSAGALAFSPDGTRFATVGSDGRVQVWENASGKRILSLGDASSIWSNLAFSPRGDMLAAGDIDGSVLLFDCKSGEPLRTLDAGAAVNGLAFSPDGVRLAIATDDVIAAVWNVASGKQALNLAGHTDLIWDVAFSEDGRYLATAGQDGTVLVWDARTGKEVQRLADGDKAVTGVDFGPDEQIATAHQDNLARIWDLRTGTHKLLFGHRDWVWDVAFSRNGQYLATASFDGTVKLWNASSAQEVSTLLPEGNQVVRVVFDPRTEYLTSTSRSTGGERKGWAKLWKAFFNDIPTLSTSSTAISGIAFSPDGKYLVIADREGKVFLWEVAGHRLDKLIDGNPIQSLAFNGHLLVASSLDGEVHLFELAGRREIGTLRGPGQAVALSPGGQRLATAGEDGMLRIWELASRRPVLVRRHGGPLLAIAFSPDSRWIATGGEDATVKIWDAMTGRNVQTLSGSRSTVLAVAFSPDGERLATASQDGTARIWNVESGETVLPPLWEHTADVTDVAFSPNGQRLATVSLDRTAKIWDAGSGRVLFTLRKHTDRLSHLAFSPDGKQLAIAGEDGMVRIEPMDIDSMIRLARGRLSRPLTKRERQIYLHE